MAEFTEIMRQWKRMCKAHLRCDNCPLVNLECYNHPPARWTYHSDKVVESIIRAWAAEHPEPIYPTWEEFLSLYGLFEPDGEGFRICVDKLNASMDADVAIRLGIESKEAEHG